MINGQIEFYDEESEWGLIRGDDGHLYELRSAQFAGPAPRVGDKVLFEPQHAAGAPRATAVRRLKPAPAPIDLRRGGVRA
jgi:cold shock CspA family protein